jgi:hypothetical protein
MLKIRFGQSGKFVVKHVEDQPSNYQSPEWKAYDQACDEAQATGQQWTEKQAQTYAAYQEAQKRGFKQ